MLCVTYRSKVADSHTLLTSRAECDSVRKQSIFYRKLLFLISTQFVANRARTYCRYWCQFTFVGTSLVEK
jgi:hypothetical protein